MVSLPNIYQGNYFLLLIPALILIILSLNFILIDPGIKLGVDFRGGMLVSLTLDEPADAEVLKSELLNEGFEADVKVFETAIGYKAEIEVPQSEKIIKADKLKESFDILLEETSTLEGLSFQDDSFKEEYLEKRSELDNTVNELFSLANIKNDSSTIPNLNHVKKAFLDAHSIVYKDYESSITKIIDNYVSYSSIYIQSVSPKLSIHFIESAINVLLLAGILSTILVFLFFRSLVPSAAVLIGAISDIIMALGAMAFFQIPLTLPSFAALLMLVGYSLDTDIMLTMRMLKRKGDPREKAHDAMKTGTTMTFTGIIAFSVLFGLSIMTNISTYYEISSVALAGLIGDLFATWGINAVVLLHYLIKKGE
ncbi:MAG: hypothetical protein PHU63_02925 [Candidatus ainarchaeum sp.]|nr:hypothetical protein [Candidatus ainarchaeum sp.]